MTRQETAANPQFSFSSRWRTTRQVSIATGGDSIAVGATATNAALAPPPIAMHIVAALDPTRCRRTLRPAAHPAPDRTLVIVVTRPSRATNAARNGPRLIGATYDLARRRAVVLHIDQVAAPRRRKRRSGRTTRAPGRAADGAEVEVR